MEEETLAQRSNNVFLCDTRKLLNNKLFLSCFLSPFSITCFENSLY